MAEREIRRAISRCLERHELIECLSDCPDFFSCEFLIDLFNLRPELETDFIQKKSTELVMRVNFNINISTNGSYTLFTDDVNNVMPLFLAITKTIGNPTGIEYSGAFVECLKITKEGIKLWKEKISDYIFVDPRIDEPFFLIKDSKLIVNIDRGITRNNKVMWSSRD